MNCRLKINIDFQCVISSFYINARMRVCVCMCAVAVFERSTFRSCNELRWRANDNSLYYEFETKKENREVGGNETKRKKSEEMRNVKTKNQRINPRAVSKSIYSLWISEIVAINMIPSFLYIPYTYSYMFTINVCIWCECAYARFIQIWNAMRIYILIYCYDVDRFVIYSFGTSKTQVLLK